MKSSNLLLLLLSLGLSSCIKDKPQEPLKTAITLNTEHRVLILNEGGYGWNNASISVYDPISNSVINEYYQQQNNGATMGDVCQSITKYNNKYYIVMNNSGKIIVTNTSDLVKTATITGFNSPRNFLPITYNKAYVSDLYANTIQVVNLNSNTITGAIHCPGGTEEMALIYNKAFVTNYKSGYCYVINTITDNVTDSIYIGKGASSIVIDKNASVWMLASGNSTTGDVGKLVRLNAVTNAIELSIAFSATESPNKLQINKTLDTLYYLNKGVYQFPITMLQLPTTAIITQGSKNYYGLGINKKDYSIYVSDAIDYVQKSKIEVYDIHGNLKTNFNAGIISNGFVFADN